MKKIYKDFLKEGKFMMVGHTSKGYEVWQSNKENWVLILKRVQYEYSGDTIRDGDNVHLHFEIVDSFSFSEWGKKKEEYIKEAEVKIIRFKKVEKPWPWNIYTIMINDNKYSFKTLDKYEDEDKLKKDILFRYKRGDLTPIE